MPSCSRPYLRPPDSRQKANVERIEALNTDDIYRASFGRLRSHQVVCGSGVLKKLFDAFGIKNGPSGRRLG
jgi:hypothetical protein